MVGVGGGNNAWLRLVVVAAMVVCSEAVRLLSVVTILFTPTCVSSIAGSAKDEVDLTDPAKRSGSLAEAVAAESLPLGTHPLHRPIGSPARVARAAAVFSTISASPTSHGGLDGGAGVSQARPPLPPPWPHAPPWRGLRLPLPPPFTQGRSRHERRLAGGHGAGSHPRGATPRRANWSAPPPVERGAAPPHTVFPWR